MAKRKRVRNNARSTTKPTAIRRNTKPMRRFGYATQEDIHESVSTPSIIRVGPTRTVKSKAVLSLASSQLKPLISAIPDNHLCRSRSVRRAILTLEGSSGHAKKGSTKSKVTCK